MTWKLVVFASAIGNDVIDLIPIAQIVAIRSASNTTPQSQQQISALDDENDNENEGNESQPPANTSKGKLEMTLQTEQRGYNSGRAYRVSPISSCLVFFRYGCSLGRSQVRVASERDRQQLEDSLSAAVAAERKRMQSKSFKKAVQSRVPHAWAPWRAGARLMRATAPNTDARPPFSQTLGKSCGARAGAHAAPPPNRSWPQCSTRQSSRGRRHSSLWRFGSPPQFSPVPCPSPAHTVGMHTILPCRWSEQQTQKSWHLSGPASSSPLELSNSPIPESITSQNSLTFRRPPPGPGRGQCGAAPRCRTG